MTKKKLLAVVAICLAILLAAVGAYAYTQISNLKNQSNIETFEFECFLPHRTLLILPFNKP